MIYFEKTLNKEYKFNGEVVNLRVDTVEMPNGNSATREIVEHNGGVCIVPVDEKGNIYMVRQYRRTFDKDLLELPAGKLAKGEDHLECGKRELKEETGLISGKMTYLCGSLPSPGYSCEIIHLYLAQDLTHSEAEPDEDEFLNVEVYSMDKVIEMIMQGEIVDGKTISAVFMAKQVINNMN